MKICIFALLLSAIAAANLAPVPCESNADCKDAEVQVWLSTETNIGGVCGTVTIEIDEATKGTMFDVGAGSTM